MKADDKDPDIPANLRFQRFGMGKGSDDAIGNGGGWVVCVIHTPLGDSRDR